MTPKIVVHHLEKSRSDRLFWLLEELNVPYDVKVHYRTKAGSAEPSLRKANPLGKAPAIELDGKLLTESGFIIHALLHNPDIALPPSIEGTTSESSVFWNHFAEGSIMMFMQPARMTSLRRRGIMADTNVPEAEKRGAKLLGDLMIQTCADGANAALAQAEKFLEENDNFSGSDKFGEGDFNMMFPINAVVGVPGPYKTGPKTQAWIKRIRGRQAWQKGMKRMLDEEKTGRSKL